MPKYILYRYGGQEVDPVNMMKNLVVKILILDYVCAVLLVVFLFFQNISESLANDLYGVLFLGFIPVLGGVNGLLVARQWGMFKSAVGRAILLLSLGLISWGLGTWIFSGVYNFLLHVEVPYPSLADVGYILSLPLWACGMVELSRATGAKFGLRSSKGKMLLLIIPILITIVSYYLLVVVARDGVVSYSDSGLLKLFFDFAYPVGDIVILTLVTLVYGLSYNYFGGIFKQAIYVVLAAFVIMYFADFSFSYTTTLETWHPGDWVDLLFTTAMLGLSVGVSMFDQGKLDRK